MNRVFRRLGATAVVIIAGAVPALHAQSSTTGALNGVVTDNNGAPVLGATIHLASGQIVRTTATSADGRYNLGLLNPGPWVVTITKSGYATGHQSVYVSVNAAATANFKLAKEGSGTVEVVATATALDATSTSTGSSYTMDALTNIPKGRDMGDVAFMTPGVSSSGFNSTDNLGLNISISGGSGADNSFSVDGLKTNDMRYGGQGVSMTQNFIDQVEVQTGGYKPEYSSMGGVFNVVTKSGGNDFAGSSWIDYTPGTLSPALKKNAFYSEAKPVDTYELGALASGAIVKDKFFYAVGLNWLQTNTPSSSNLGGLTVGAINTPNYQFFSKFNYFINTNNQLTLSYFGNDQTATQDPGAAPGNLLDGRGNQNSANKTTNNSNNISLIYDASLSPTLFMSIKLGQADKLNQVKPGDSSPEVIDYTYYKDALGAFPGGPGAGTGVTPGTRWATGGLGDFTKETNTTKQASIDFTWILGDHSLKAGFSDMTSRYEEHDHRTGPDSAVWYVNIDKTGNTTVGKRVYTNDSVANAEFQALYLQDTWQVNNTLNLFYGARAEHQLQKGDNGQAFMNFGFGKYIQPRIGFTWDIKGDATSKLSGSYAKYYEQIPQRMAIRTYGNEFYQQYYYGSHYGTANIPWTATTSTAPWDAVAGMTAGATVNFSTGWSHDPIADNVHLPQRVELQLGYDQQVSTTTTLGIHGHYRKLTNPMEDSEIVLNNGSGQVLDPYDPVGQAIIWNPGPGPVSWTDLSGHHVTFTNTGYPTAYNEYKAVDISYTRKTLNNYLFIGYTWSKNYGNYEGLISPSNGQADGNITASFDYPPYVGTGLLPIDHEHAFKAYGFQKFEFGKDALQLGFNLMAQSGAPISMQDNGDSTYGVGLGDPGGYGNSTFVNGLMGNYGRTPFQVKLDVNASWQHPLTAKMRLTPFIQIYNLLNARPTLSVYEQATDVNGNPVPAGKWGSATSYQAQRSIEFGARLTF